MIVRLLVIACVAVARYGMAAVLCAVVAERLMQRRAHEIANTARIRAEVDL